MLRFLPAGWEAGHKKQRTFVGARSEAGEEEGWRAEDVDESRDAKKV